MKRIVDLLTIYIKIRLEIIQLVNLVVARAFMKKAKLPKTKLANRKSEFQTEEI